MKIWGHYFDNESYQLSEQECIAIASATQELLDTGDYTSTISGEIDVQITQLCEELYIIMDFADDDTLVDKESGIDEIVYLVCAGEGLL